MSTRENAPSAEASNILNKRIETVSPILNLIESNQNVIQDISSSPEKLGHVGAMAEKLVPSVSNLLKNPEIKTLVENFTSADTSKTTNLIGEAIEMFTSQTHVSNIPQQEVLTSGISRLQTILNKESGSTTGTTGISCHNNSAASAPVLNIVKGLLEMSKRRNI